VGEKAMKLGRIKAENAGERSNRAMSTREVWELRFLEYRLEVVGSWPDSPRKSATIEAILGRLGRSGS